MEDMEDNKLIEGLMKIYEESDPKFADFSINCQNGQIVKSHKLILAIRSEYFDGLFRLEPNKTSIDLSDFSFEVVKAVIQSMIVINEENLVEVGVIEVIQLADFLQMEHLIKVSF